MTDDGFTVIGKKKGRPKKSELWANSMPIELPEFVYSIKVSKRNDQTNEYEKISKPPWKEGQKHWEPTPATIIFELNTAVRSLMKDKGFGRNDFFYKPEWSPKGLFVSRKLATKAVRIGPYEIGIYISEEPGKTNEELRKTVLRHIFPNIVKEYVEPCWISKGYEKYTQPTGFVIWRTKQNVRSPAFLEAVEAISARCRLEDDNKIYLEIVVYPHEIKNDDRCLLKLIDDLAVFHKYGHYEISELIDVKGGRKATAKTHIREALLGLNLLSPNFTISQVSTSTWPEGWKNAKVVFPPPNSLSVDKRKTSSIIRRCRLSENDHRKSIEKYLKIFSDYVNGKGLPFKMGKNLIYEENLLLLPQLEFADGVKVPSVNGTWRVEKFYEGASIGKWLVIYTENVPVEAREGLIEPIIETARKQGMVVEEPTESSITLKEDDFEDLLNYQLLNSNQEKEYDFVFLFCNSESRIPDALRKLAKQHGIVFMIMRMGNVLEKTMLAVQKMNILNGGVCARVCDTTEHQSRKDLHIGISYDTVGRKQIGGLCAFSWRFLVERGFYDETSDFSGFLTKCNEICKAEYVEREQSKPDRVYFYICRVNDGEIEKAFESNKDFWGTARVTVIFVCPEYNLKLFPNPPYRNSDTKISVGTVINIRSDVFLLCSYAPYFDTPQIYRYTVLQNGTRETAIQLQSLTLKLCHQHLVNMSKKMPYIAFFAENKNFQEKKRQRIGRSYNTNEGWRAYDEQANEEDAAECVVFKRSLSQPGNVHV